MQVRDQGLTRSNPKTSKAAVCFSDHVSWTLVFPVWVFLISLYILLENSLAGSAGRARAP